MDSLQEQIAGLSVQIDGLHQVIERLASKISAVVQDVQVLTGDNHGRLQTGLGAGHHVHPHRYESSFSMEHKDVLMDDPYPDTEHHSGERILTPDIQVQRLTAQLTAAYNRIAALEEQLLSQRIH